MNVEKTIEYILDMQAKAEERAAKAEVRADRADRRMDRLMLRLLKRFAWSS